ncbi:BCCT family transporter [Psychrobacter sp. N25K4-3-2]|uniref:BCCT family transporter n=1 Tax=Psychrobacter sp. N25K4-3-2 TaxID=2785026 RepID=UPI001889FBBF|nr:BCCT family transporter [Psychrobacter sp. N25K4-3-2]MBF4488284.1 BCCT family transporter [Psychrobacter sp. N25K4-3-2]
MKNSSRKPLTKLPIKVATKGFYEGFNKDVTITAKILLGLLIVWAVIFPDNSTTILGSINTFLLNHFSTWYILCVAFFLILALILAVVPRYGRLILGDTGDKPEFSNFSWFSMIFGAGIGVGMLTFATAEPMYHFANNPEVIQGLATASGADNVRYAYKWAFLHWGFSAWICYSLVGLSMAYFSFRRKLPLTIRSGLAPLFGQKLSGKLGNTIDIVAVIATILGVAQTLGFGVEQFVSSMYRVGLGEWLMNTDGTSSTAAIIVALTVIVGIATLSALSGLGKGVKWLSNINMGLSLILFAFFLIFGSTFFGLQSFFLGVFDYVVALPQLLFTVWQPDGTVVGDTLATWQKDWSVFYWAWWIAFGPFVGVFFARISRGRSIRAYLFGTVILPALMCFIWFSMVGGTAIDLTLGGTDAISSVGQESQLLAMLDVMLSPNFSWVMAILVLVLLLTYLVTTLDSAILVINTINSGGNEGPKGRPHIIFWGVILALVVGVLLISGGLGAIKTAMVIGALPFSFVMVLMGISLVKAILYDTSPDRLETIDPVDES